MAEVTNYIDRLVAELCPDGVEYRPLGEIVKIKNGKGYKDFLPGNIPVYGSGGVMTYVDTFAYDKPTVLIPRKGSLGNLFYLEEPFWNVDTIFYTEIDESCVIPKYLFYVLKSAELEKLNTAGGVPSLTQKVLNKVLIPVPPLEIQEAIVEILDKFTNLEAELEAELEARTLQYEYYRDSLLASFSESAVKFYSIEELFTTRNGYTPSKSNSSYWENGTVPWFRMEDIRENGGVLSEALQSVHESALKKGGMFPAGSIIVATSATIGEHALINVDFLCNQRFTVLTPKEEFKSLLLPKFLYYYSFVLDRWCLANTTQSSFASVDMKRFKKFEFPLPSLEEQQRIVDILDRFDSLTTSLSEGLPAELAARRSQYEYYRDQLLTFPRKGENQ